MYVIHENDEWVAPLRAALSGLRIPFVEWFVDEGHVSLDGVPPEGLFYNRMSASSHTRAHRYSVELSEALLSWLESHDRKVINGSRALHLEVRKFEQYLGLKEAGIRVPGTLAACGREAIIAAARALGETPFILKPNRGGKGLGVELFDSLADLERRLPDEPVSLDGIALVQQYVRPADGTITRMEFIGGKFYYAVRVDASDGFELCPADECADEDAFCPGSDAGNDAGTDRPSRFRIDEDFNDPELVGSMEAFLRANQIEIAAAEFAEDVNGHRWVYDLNTNTNYNRQAEFDSGGSRLGMQRVAEYLGELLSGQGAFN
ncbi:MAG: alpha-L-glutamate ligase [Wenzhouxiangella sp.]|nr:MAG: alpha-L-glutamate ligase [Wenzhouxiangella sp.]